MRSSEPFPTRDRPGGIASCASADRSCGIGLKPLYFRVAGPGNEIWPFFRLIIAGPSGTSLRGWVRRLRNGKSSPLASGGLLRWAARWPVLLVILARIVAGQQHSEASQGWTRRSQEELVEAFGLQSNPALQRGRPESGTRECHGRLRHGGAGLPVLREAPTTLAEQCETCRGKIKEANHGEGAQMRSMGGVPGNVARQVPGAEGVVSEGDEADRQRACGVGGPTTQLLAADTSGCGFWRTIWWRNPSEWPSTHLGGPGSLGFFHGPEPRDANEHRRRDHPKGPPSSTACRGFHGRWTGRDGYWSFGEECRRRSLPCYGYARGDATAAQPTSHATHSATQARCGEKQQPGHSQCQDCTATDKRGDAICWFAARCFGSLHRIAAAYDSGGWPEHSEDTGQDGNAAISAACVSEGWGQADSRGKGQYGGQDHPWGQATGQETGGSTGTCATGDIASQRFHACRHPALQSPGRRRRGSRDHKATGPVYHGVRCRLENLPFAWMLRIASQRISAFGQSCNSLVRGLPCLLLAIRRYLASGIVLSLSRHANCTLFWVVQCTGSSYRPPSCPDPLFLPGVRCSPCAERSFLCVPPCSSTYGHLPAALITRVSTFGLPSISFPVMHWGRSHLSSRCAYHKISIESCSSVFGSHNLESRLGKSLRLPCLPRDAPFHAGFHAATILHGLRSILCDGQASSYVPVTRCIGSDRLFRVGAYIIHNPFCGHKMFVHVECTLSCEPLRAGFYGGLPVNCEPSPASGGAPPLFPAAKYGKSDCSSLCTASNFNRGVGSWLGKRLCCCDASVLYAAYHAPSHVPQLQKEPYSMLPQWASYFELMPPSLNMSMLADAGICCAVPLPTCQGRMPIGGVEGTFAKPLRSLLYVSQGTQSCFGFSLHHAEDLISMWFESFCRSALVFYFLAVLHLVFYVLPLRQGCPVGNSVVRTVRKTTRGAPLLLAMGFALYLLPGAAAMHGNNHQPAEEAEQREMPASIRPNFVSYPHSTEDLINACDNWSVDVLGFRIATVLLRFQRTHTISCQWWDPGMNSSLLCAMVKDDCSDDDGFYAVVAANPQPGLDTVVLGEVPQWLLSSMSVPVFITVLGTQEPCFMEFSTGRVTHQDVRIATGDLWPPGAEIFVGFSSVPLAEDDLITPTPG